MPSMTDAPVAVTAATRPQLPKRPIPHEKTPDRPNPGSPRPHARTVVDREVGPRRPGAIYQNVDGRFEVLVLVTDPGEAAQMLRRKCARWALIVRDTLRADGQPFVVGTVWTDSDHLVREGHTAYAPAA
ncbi:hypothetical protein QFZ75_000061 [Streptomyces sp. V3I8]|uniref:hypothetical protein n=1 Tax=Streptomyces sp. V3I8 TaxID=3042279 RepID=UPI002787F958|nr:hypothetical protein [Streptomyces sp. V3I8]MDQ1033645.1 hypothetical protein [Streptomyces sp. V3I8]